MRDKRCRHDNFYTYMADLAFFVSDLLAEELSSLIYRRLDYRIDYAEDDERDAEDDEEDREPDVGQAEERLVAAPLHLLPSDEVGRDGAEDHVDYDDDVEQHQQRVIKCRERRPVRDGGD